MNAITDQKKMYIATTFQGLSAANDHFDAMEFDGCVFKECDLSGCVFKACRFVDCQFIKSNLSLIKVDHCTISDVSFDACKIVGVDWTKVSWPQVALSTPLKFYNCTLNDSSFFGLCLEEIVVEACKAHDVDFREGDFCAADFSGTDFSNSLFGQTNLKRANFKDAVDYAIDVRDNDVAGAVFSRFEAVHLLSGLGINLVD